MKIRIFSGYLKNQIIHTINHNLLKPTMNIIKETLFNWLSNKIKNKTCLDCFSGSGALGIEAISHYAKFVVLLEKNYKIIKQIHKNINRLKINNLKIIHTDAIYWIKKQSQKYDIIFLDPPYHSNILQKTIYLIHKKKIIKHKGYIYIEMFKNQNILYPKNWILYKTKNINNTTYALYNIK